MRVTKWIDTGALSLFLGTFLLGTTVLIQAQDQRDDTKPAQPENRPEATRPSPQQDESTPSPKEAKPSKQDEDKPTNQDKSARQDEDKTSRSEDRAPKQGESKSQAARGGKSDEAAEKMAGRRGGHIPDDKFHANFGQQHKFKMQRPTIVEGQSTFQYNGYSFVLVDAWPMDWAYTDDCYIDYIDGEYFLFDLAHPGVRLAIFVVM